MKTPPRPPDRQRGNIYVERHIHAGETINNPIEYARRNLDHLAGQLCKAGLLRRAKKHELQGAPSAGVRRVAIGNHWYIVRASCSDGEALQVEQLQDLWFAADALADAYDGKRIDDALWLAFEIGATIERIGILSNDRIMGTGRRRQEIATAMRVEAAKSRRITPERRQAILDKLRRKCSLQAIARDLKCAKKTVLKVRREAIAAGELTA